MTADTAFISIFLIYSTKTPCFQFHFRVFVFRPLIKHQHLLLSFESLSSELFLVFAPLFTHKGVLLGFDRFFLFLGPFNQPLDELIVCAFGVTIRIEIVLFRDHTFMRFLLGRLNRFILLHIGRFWHGKHNSDFASDDGLVFTPSCCLIEGWRLCKLLNKETSLTGYAILAEVRDANVVMVLAQCHDIAAEQGTNSWKCRHNIEAYRCELVRNVLLLDKYDITKVEPLW